MLTGEVKKEKVLCFIYDRLRSESRLKSVFH